MWTSHITINIVAASKVSQARYLHMYPSQTLTDSEKIKRQVKTIREHISGPAEPGREIEQRGRTSRLIDNFGREITYLRLAITDRCNLRCRYCRPEEGVPFIPHGEILSFEEMERLVSLLAGMGVSKVRLTGGEPFSRRGVLDFLFRLRDIPGVESLHITSNGVKTYRFLDQLAELGLAGLNLSLDTLDAQRFRQITRRNYLESVLETLQGALKRAIPLKVNSVVLADTTDEEILALAELAKKYPLTLRFIERMPFSGTERKDPLADGNLRPRMQRLFPAITECASKGPTTARVFSLPGYQGKLGIIEGFARSFCRTCNKVRITPVGILKTCLYDRGALDLKALLRGGVDDGRLREAIVAGIHRRFANGHEAEHGACRGREPSMSTIGG